MMKKMAKIPYILCILLTTVFISNTSVHANMISSYDNMTLGQLRLALWYEGYESRSTTDITPKKPMTKPKAESKKIKEYPEELRRALQKALEIVS